MSELTFPTKVMLMSCGFKDSTSAEYKAQKAKRCLENAQDRAYSTVVASIKEIIIKKSEEDKEGYWKWYDSYADEL